MEVKNLIEFIHDKSFSLNNEIILSNKKIKVLKTRINNDNLYKSYTQISKIICLNKNRQYIIVFLMEILKDIVRFQKASKNIKSKETHDIILNFCIDKSIKWNIEYNKTHPLYNYKPFFEKLFKYYLINEKYEKCAELLKHGKISTAYKQKICVLYQI